MGDNLFTREEVLEGLPARRATHVLFLIEMWTAKMMLLSRQAAAVPLVESTSEQNLGFLAAFSSGHGTQPRIQHLERYAPDWAHLVPDNARLRAVVAHLLGQKYRF